MPLSLPPLLNASQLSSSSGDKEAIANPDETAAITANYALDGKDPVMVSASIKLRIVSSLSAGTRQHGLGWIDPGPYQKSAEIYKLAGFINKDLDMRNFMTLDLVDESS